MRQIDQIILHCSATPEGRDHSAADIDRWHRGMGWTSIGYHYVIRLNGVVERGRPVSVIGAHARNWNASSIGICYIGGVSADDVKLARDTRTAEQKCAMAALVHGLLGMFPGADVLGHRDLPGVAKACPSFDARAWWKEVSNVGKQ
jgi:N-acetylmuramoyl-L-alanine amidase